MIRATRRLALSMALAGGAAGAVLANTSLVWEELRETDWLYSLATRFADVDGHRVHYPTPTAELLPLLEARSETAARRQLAEVRLALGDRQGAATAMGEWAQAQGSTAWAEAARWYAAHGEMALAFEAAARALPSIDPDERNALSGEQIEWAEAHPELADPLALRAERARLLPDDEQAAESWIRGLQKAGRLDEAIAAVDQLRVLPADRQLLLRSDLAADHADAARAFAILDAAIESAEGWPLELKRAYAVRTLAARPADPEAWRGVLDERFEPKALLRLATFFQGQERGDQAADLLRQIERRYESGLDRSGLLLVARLHAEIDAVPEAFRARLAAASRASTQEQQLDLAALARLALRAGARPLGWGTYNDEPHRWVARIDRTPGFWTGGVSFLLTGADWREALERLETDSLAERTFATARALVAELAARSPSHPELPGLRAALMTRHVERGEGQQALDLLPLAESGPSAAVDEARRAALLAMRQVEAPLETEVRLWRARLAQLAPDGSRPERAADPWRHRPRRDPESGSAWTRSIEAAAPPRYDDVLDDAIVRLDERDRSHRAAVDLMLHEMDRLPRAEALWLRLAERLARWNLDDEIGPRYERALERFSDASWWSRTARWYARQSRHRELDRLAEELAARFRAAAVFERAPVDDRVRLSIPEGSRDGVRVTLVPWGDWVRVQALRRFPHSPTVYREATSRLSQIVDPKLLEDRGYAILFADAGRRDAYLAEAFRTGTLAEKIARWEAAANRTPVEELLLFDGRARLSEFEQAAPAATRLAALYPGDGALARKVLTLLRSLSGLDPGQARPARELVQRTAPALEDATALWTELGELEHEAGRPAAAVQAWQRILDRAQRDGSRIEALATVLWDYGEMGEALGAIEAGRRRLGRPALLSFEAGVLREEARDVEGALREYLQAAIPDEGSCWCSAWETDQRALRRLSQLLGRPRVRAAIEARLAALAPGSEKDEQSLVAFFPLTTIEMPGAGFEWTVDDWIDQQDHPVDPLARQARSDARETWRAAALEGRQRVAAALLARTRSMIEAATRAVFLDSVERWLRPLLSAQPDRQDEVTLTAAVMSRRIALAATPEERITRQIARASYLFSHGRTAEADAAWNTVAAAVASLPEGAPRLRAEAQRAAYLERSSGASVAAAEWERLSTRYPWSLGILEDRVAFLSRAGRGPEARAVLERAAQAAAAGHRESLLERLAREAIAHDDLGQAQRAVEALLAERNLDDARRLAAAHLLARLDLRRNPQADLLALARREEPRVQGDARAHLYAQLARAAGLETAWGPSLTLWIEALNRRLDRGFVREAARAAEKGDQGATLVRFFAAQRERSPRDVRWAVALRELNLYFGDTAAALEAARAAIAVRPDRVALWYEAADLLARLGRPREAADLLGELAKSRPADEETARRRAEHLATASDDDGALAVERAALLAFSAERELDEQRTWELSARRGRAVQRLMDLGLPRQAHRLLTAKDETLASADLGAWTTVQVALAAGRFLPLLRQRIGDEDFVSSAASVVSDRATPEQKEEVVRWIGDAVLPPTTGQPARRGRTDLGNLWRFAEQAGLGEAVRVELARRALTRRPGPWNDATPEALLDAVAPLMVDESGDSPRLGRPDLEAAWFAQLVRDRRGEEAWFFLAPRWDALLAEVRGTTPVDASRRYDDWRRWLNRDAIGLLAPAAVEDPARRDGLVRVLTARRAWNRFWALGAKDWDVGPFVAALPEEARAQWFRMWLSPSPDDANPELRARGEALLRSALALGRLVSGRTGSAADPVVAELRGPRTVGAILAAPRPSRDLWGERPGPSWLVLEALARHRGAEPDAALVALEVADRSGETVRARLGARMAEAAGELELALALATEIPGTEAADRARRIRLLQRSGRADEATVAWRDAVRALQPRLTEATFRGLVRAADDAALADPLSLLDPQTPVPAGLLAYLCEVRGLQACGTLKPLGLADFRGALAARYRARQRPLTADETRHALRELWANDAGPLPAAGLRKLGPPWSLAIDWLDTVRSGERFQAIAAVDALPDLGPLRALMARDPNPTPQAHLLLVKALLLDGQDEQARTLAVQALSATDPSSGLSFTPVSLSPPDTQPGEDGEFAEESSQAYETVDPLVASVRVWLEVFGGASKLALIEEPAREALLSRTAAAPRDATAWALALDLAKSEPARAQTLEAIERAWRLGDLEPTELAPVVAAAGRVSAADADRWLSRLRTGPTLAAVATRARLLADLGRKAEAARSLTQGRGRGGWSATDEIQAFDQWRRLAPAAPPAADPWTLALPFWTRPAAEIGPALIAHLRAHPLDLRAARAALRSCAPLEEDASLLAARTLRQPGFDGDAWRDQQILDLRAARSWLPRSAPTAAAILEDVQVTVADELERRRMPQSELVASLADVVRTLTRSAPAGRPNPPSAEAALAALEDRDPTRARAVRAEMRSATAPPPPYRVLDGRPEAWRPMDLDWGVVRAVLDAEGIR